MVIDITIDTREQTPWHFSPDKANVTRGTLKTGDYAITDDDGFAVERKSFDDFLGTISSGWDRFSRELSRAREAGFTMPIIVEGWIDDCLYTDTGSEIVAPASKLNHPRLTSYFILSRIGQIWQLGGCVLPAGTSTIASAIAYEILVQRQKAISECQTKTS